nr:hypothetical protein [uncultured Cupriavidus sp.]
MEEAMEHVHALYAALALLHSAGATDDARRIAQEALDEAAEFLTNRPSPAP